MPLTELRLAARYRSGAHVIADDLYARCLPLARTYHRAVGFFSSSVFDAAPDAFAAFFGAGGRMRLVCSPVLSRLDVDALVRAFRDRPALVRATRAGAVQTALASGRTAESLALLVAGGALELKIAVVTAAARAESIYHEKLGVLDDVAGHQVVFRGSANESWRALRGNFEVVDVFRSWEPSESRRVRQAAADFDALWTNTTPRLAVHGAADALRRGLVWIRADAGARSHGENGPGDGVDARDGVTGDAIGDATAYRPPPRVLAALAETLAIPGDLALRAHQRAAIVAWFRAGGRGMLEMATGSGKTVTALAAAAKLYEQVGGPLVVVVVCPYLHLVTQWGAESARFGLDPLECALGRRAWEEALTTRLFNVAAGTRPIASVVVSNATFAGAPFQAALASVAAPLLLIADEAHNLGAPQLAAALPPHATYRLGLSATPARAHDEPGTARLTAYFGPSVFRYSLAAALADGVLCPYTYVPVAVELTEDEADEYVELTARIARAVGRAGDVDAAGSPAHLLIVQRARLLATARNKLPALERLLRGRTHTTHNLIYCGDGTVDGPADAGVERQIEAVTRLVGRTLGMRAATYTADTGPRDRARLRAEFADGTLQCLVAIRCLDEGVDIPETRRAYILASSINPRQFVQRRGRVLRRAPGKDVAEVVDLVVVPPDAAEAGAAARPGVPHPPSSRRSPRATCPGSSSLACGRSTTQASVGEYLTLGRGGGRAGAPRRRGRRRVARRHRGARGLRPCAHRVHRARGARLRAGAQGTRRAGTRARVG